MNTKTKSTIPAINQPWPEQGGIYIGARLIDGAVHHIVIPGGVEFDHEDVPFSRVELVVAEGDELNGHSDWRAPDQEDLMLAYINAREHFDKSSWYWSRSEHHGWPWAVDFEDGLTDRAPPVQRVPCPPLPQFSRFIPLTIRGRSPPRYGAPH